MNLPNVLTVLRIFLTFLLVFFLYQEGLASTVLALGVFTLASFTDFLDGYYARRHNLVSQFGKIMDPVADKFLILSVFFVFTHMGLIAGWMFIVVFLRGIIVTGLRFFAMRKGIALAAEGAGKMKTVLQIIAVYLIIISIILAQLSLDIPWYGNLIRVLADGTYIFMLCVVLITLWSGLSFVWNNRKKIFC